jgi:hypothetical protein
VLVLPTGSNADDVCFVGPRNGLREFVMVYQDQTGTWRLQKALPTGCAEVMSVITDNEKLIAAATEQRPAPVPNTVGRRQCRQFFHIGATRLLCGGGVSGGNLSVGTCQRQRRQATEKMSLLVYNRDKALTLSQTGHRLSQRRIRPDWGLGLGDMGKCRRSAGQRPWWPDSEITQSKGRLGANLPSPRGYRMILSVMAETPGVANGRSYGVHIGALMPDHISQSCVPRVMSLAGCGHTLVFVAFGR